MSDIVTTRVFTDGEKGITAAKLNDIVGSSVIQPAFVSAKPVASSTAAGDNLLLLTSGGTYAKIDSTVFASAMVPLLPDPNPKIWSARLRSFNAIGNPTFEVDQRTAGAGITVSNTGFALDRWAPFKTASTTFTATARQTTVAGTVVPVPGTSFGITANYLRVTVGTAQATLGASESFLIIQNIEGIRLRELIADVHSVSILMRSSVANLKCGLILRDSNNTHSLAKLFQLSATPNTWSLVQLPNIPVFTASGVWSVNPGALGYSLMISLGAGASVTASANDVWLNASYNGALGQDNFAATAGAIADIAFIQHEPGNLCSNPPMDCPFTQNYDDCLRYYTKSYAYGTAIGSVANPGVIQGLFTAGTSPITYVPFKKTMAKTPTLTAYSNASGAANMMRDNTAAADKTVTGPNIVGDAGFDGFVISSPNASNWNGAFHYTSDTGW